MSRVHGVEIKNLPTIIRRITNQLDKSDACWTWLGCKNNHGYGVLRVGGRKGRTVLVHRFMMCLVKGIVEVPPNVLHKCHNPACCNPLHLYFGDQRQNMIDAYLAGSRGKLTPEDVLMARVRYKAGESSAAIARSFGIKNSSMHKLLNYQSWAFV